MISSESRRDWMHRFGSRLMKLEPTLNAVTAAQRAARAYDRHATDSEPEDAAAIVANEKADSELAELATPADQAGAPLASRG